MENRFPAFLVVGDIFTRCFWPFFCWKINEMFSCCDNCSCAFTHGGVKSGARIQIHHVAEMGAGCLLPSSLISCQRWNEKKKQQKIKTSHGVYFEVVGYALYVCRCSVRECRLSRAELRGEVPILPVVWGRCPFFVFWRQTQSYNIICVPIFA